jgi:ATP-dependent RNA helicase DDX18/HAS1
MLLLNGLTWQLEKLLQKNYFLHQSAKDGFRSYLQAYASYSLKKIFDINALDLAKVGKSFGFAVPPRVSLNIAQPKSSEAGSKKRRRDDESEEEIIMEEVTNAQDVDAAESDDDTQEADQGSRFEGRRQGKQRRMETLGHKKVQKEVYKKGKERKKMNEKTQWSR